MSVITDSVRLLNRESAAFAFLPAINYIYIYWELPNPGTTDTIMVITALFISAVGFNILTQVDFEPYSRPSMTETQYEELSSHENEAIDVKSLFVLIVAIIMWLILLIYSLVLLWDLFAGGNIWPGIFLGISALFICLVVSDLLLTRLLPIYHDEKSKSP